MSNTPDYTAIKLAVYRKTAGNITPDGVLDLCAEVERLQSEVQQLRAAPIDMLLFCPRCELQHIDAPDERTPGWTNPPHKSHLCHGCGHIWRPCDRPTNGVEKIETHGLNDGSPQPRLTGDLEAARTAHASAEYVKGVEFERDALAKQLQDLDRVLKDEQCENEMLTAALKESQAEIASERERRVIAQETCEKLESALKEYADTEKWGCVYCERVVGDYDHHPSGHIGDMWLGDGDGPDLAQSVLGVGKER